MPILTSVIANRLKAIGERMGLVVERSARSPLLVEGRDFSLGIYDAEGVLLEQTEYIPVLGYATAPGMRAIARAFAGNVQEGDVVLHNDPFTRRQPAIGLEGREAGVPRGRALRLGRDRGPPGRRRRRGPGLVQPERDRPLAGGAADHAAQALRGRRRRDDVWDFVFGNVRLDVVAEDVSAMIGSCTVGERELKALLARYGTETVRGAAASLLDAAEQAASAVIERMPDGVYRAEWYVHDDGIDHDLTATIRVEITIEGSRLRFDFSETDPQVTGYVNAPLAVTISSVMIAFFMVADEELPHNDGIMRCIEVDRARGEPRQPALPGPDRLRQPPLRPDRGGDHARARPGGAPPGHGVLEPPARDDRRRLVDARERARTSTS